MYKKAIHFWCCNSILTNFNWSIYIATTNSSIYPSTHFITSKFSKMLLPVEFYCSQDQLPSPIIRFHNPTTQGPLIGLNKNSTNSLKGIPPQYYWLPGSNTKTRLYNPNLLETTHLNNNTHFTCSPAFALSNHCLQVEYSIIGMEFQHTNNNQYSMI